jgi:hypothetical protein
MGGAFCEMLRRTQGGAYGNNKDQWSYKDWVYQVPRCKHFESHPLISIMWP